MSNNFKFVLNTQGVSQLLNSKEMKDVLSDYADQVKTKAGRGYYYSVRNASDRAKGYVHASTKEAQRDNLKNNTLLRNL